MDSTKNGGSSNSIPGDFPDSNSLEGLLLEITNCYSGWNDFETPALFLFPDDVSVEYDEIIYDEDDGQSFVFAHIPNPLFQPDSVYRVTNSYVCSDFAAICRHRQYDDFRFFILTLEIGVLCKIQRIYERPTARNFSRIRHFLF